jgi:uncharacterized protein
VLGILLVNIQAFSMPGAAYLNPSAYGDLTGANLAVWIVTHVFFDQKFISIFSMLFGAGIVLLADRTLAAGGRPAAVHYRRMFWLLLIGLAHAYFIWYGDILVTYALCGMILYPLRKRSPRTLIILAVLWTAIGSMLMLASGASMSGWPPAMAEQFTRDNWLPTADMLAREVAVYRSGWLTQLPMRAGAAFGFQTFIFMILMFWRVGGLVMLGMALHTLGVFSGAASRRTYVALIAVALIVGVPVVAFGAWRNFEAAWNVRYSFFFGMQFNHWAGALVALGWIAAMVLVAQSGVLRGLVSRLEAVGRMALTHYIAQSLICTLIFYGHGLSLFGQVDRVWQAAIVLAIWVVQLLIAPVLVRRLRFGPLEWLWRSLTYGRRQPYAL